MSPYGINKFKKLRENKKVVSSSYTRGNSGSAQLDSSKSLNSKKPLNVNLRDYFKTPRKFDSNFELKKNHQKAKVAFLKSKWKRKTMSLKLNFSSNNFIKLASQSDKFNEICKMLSYFFNKPIELELTRIHQAYNEVNILTSVVTIFINRYKVDNLMKKCLNIALFDFKDSYKFTFKSKDNRVEALQMKINNAANSYLKLITKTNSKQVGYNLAKMDKSVSSRAVASLVGEGREFDYKPFSGSAISLLKNKSIINTSRPKMRKELLLGEVGNKDITKHTQLSPSVKSYNSRKKTSNLANLVMVNRAVGGNQLKIVPVKTSNSFIGKKDELMYLDVAYLAGMTFRAAGRFVNTKIVPKMTTHTKNYGVYSNHHAHYKE